MQERLCSVVVINHESHEDPRTVHEATVVDLGFTSYGEAWDLQKRLFQDRCAGLIGDVLLLTEHEHVFTLGRNSSENHLLANADERRQLGAEVFHIDRGGDITYHGPGQLVGYPILDLNNYYLDTHRYLRDLEEVIVRTLADYRIDGKREEGYTGVWVGGDKIAAIGVKVSRWVTMHGFALNVNTDVSYFDRIIPCGIFNKGVTSMERVLRRKVEVREVTEKLVNNFGQVFCVKPVRGLKEELINTQRHEPAEKE